MGLWFQTSSLNKCNVITRKEEKKKKKKKRKLRKTLVIVYGKKYARESYSLLTWKFLRTSLLALQRDRLDRNCSLAISTRACSSGVPTCGLNFHICLPTKLLVLNNHGPSPSATSSFHISLFFCSTDVWELKFLTEISRFDTPDIYMLENLFCIDKPPVYMYVFVCAAYTHLRGN